MEDIPGIHVEIDDILSETPTMEEVLSIFRKVLMCYREKNIKLARHKLEFGTEVNFAGTHIGDPEGYRPTTTKINGILDLSAPTNLMELRSFLNCWNQLRYYVLDYQHLVDQLQKPLCKDVPFSEVH